MLEKIFKQESVKLEEDYHSSRKLVDKLLQDFRRAELGLKPNTIAFKVAMAIASSLNENGEEGMISLEEITRRTYGKHTARSVEKFEKQVARIRATISGILDACNEYYRKGKSLLGTAKKGNKIVGVKLMTVAELADWTAANEERKERLEDARRMKEIAINRLEDGEQKKALSAAIGG